MKTRVRPIYSCKLNKDKTFLLLNVYHSIQIASIRVQLNQLREELDESVKNQDFSKAAEIKTTIAELDIEKKNLLETTEAVEEEVRTERVSTAIIIVTVIS